MVSAGKNVKMWMILSHLSFDGDVPSNGSHSLLDGASESEVLSSATICARNVAIRKRSQLVEVTDLYYICIYI